MSDDGALVPYEAIECRILLIPRPEGNAGCGPGGALLRTWGRILKCHRGRGMLLGGKEEAGGRPGCHRRPDRPDLASDLSSRLCEGRTRRDEAACGASIEGRFSRREITDHRGLHYVTISSIVRAKEREKRQDGMTESKGRQGPAVDRDTNTKDLTPFFRDSGGRP